MLSIPVTVKNKNGIIDIFEKLSRCQQVIMLKSGDYLVDAHSIMGVFSIDSSKPFELLFQTEPDSELKKAISAYTL